MYMYLRMKASLRYLFLVLRRYGKAQIQGQLYFVDLALHIFFIGLLMCILLFYRSI